MFPFSESLCKIHLVTLKKLVSVFIKLTEILHLINVIKIDFFGKLQYDLLLLLDTTTINSVVLLCSLLIKFYC